MVKFHNPWMTIIKFCMQYSAKHNALLALRDAVPDRSSDPPAIVPTRRERAARNASQSPVAARPAAAANLTASMPKISSIATRSHPVWRSGRHAMAGQRCLDRSNRVPRGRTLSSLPCAGRPRCEPGQESADRAQCQDGRC